MVVAPMSTTTVYTHRTDCSTWTTKVVTLVVQVEKSVNVCVCRQ